MKNQFSRGVPPEVEVLRSI